MKSSIRQVAELANVSHATVSRVLNNVDVRIAHETRQRVHRIAAELGYQPNRAARALVTGRTQTLALWSSNLRSAYNGEAIHHTHQEITRHGYDLIVSSAQVHDDLTLNTSKLLSWPVDGVLAFDLPRGTIPGLKNSLVGGIPLISMGAYVVEEADSVRVDFTNAVTEAIRHLVAVGCRRIAYLVPDWFEWFRECGDARLQGYETAIAEMGRQPEYVVTANEKRADVPDVLEAYVERHGCPDGLFCFNDDMAVAAFSTLRGLSLRIPEDVALVGCDGIDDTSYFDPPLTTIVQPLQQMCAAAWSLLQKRIEQPSLPLQKEVLACRLEVRGSSRR